MTDTPKQIWATGNDTTGSWNHEKGRMKIHLPDGWQKEYHRADLSADLVRAALERAAESADSIALPMDGRLAKTQAHYMRSVTRDTIRAIAKDDEAVEAIITSVLGEKK
jgi:hypothetical protein